MNDSFKPLPRTRIAKSQLAHLVTVQSALGSDHLRPKLAGQLTYGRAAWRTNLAGDEVCIHHHSAAVGQGLGDCAFSTADAPCQADALDALRHGVTNR
jgi:hypothetical protein